MFAGYLAYYGDAPRQDLPCFQLLAICSIFIKSPFICVQLKHKVVSRFCYELSKVITVDPLSASSLRV